MDYSKINIEKVYIKRHLEIAVVSVENDVMTFKVADQFYVGDEFSKQANKHEFTAKNGITIRLCGKLEWDGFNRILSIRRFWNINNVDETADCYVHQIVDILQAITEYNETNGKGYEKPWPQNGDKYLCIDSAGCINEYDYDNDYMDEVRREFGNFFRTREEAEAALDRVRKALKGVDENKLLREALEEAIEMYGPWNVPGDAGGWISKARKALEAGNE